MSRYDDPNSHDAFEDADHRLSRWFVWALCVTAATAFLFGMYLVLGGRI